MIKDAIANWLRGLGKQSPQPPLALQFRGNLGANERMTAQDLPNIWFVTLTFFIMHYLSWQARKMIAVMPHRQLWEEVVVNDGEGKLEPAPKCGICQTRVHSVPLKSDLFRRSSRIC
jgi:hypothetical protein